MQDCQRNTADMVGVEKMQAGMGRPRVSTTALQFPVPSGQPRGLRPRVP